MRVRRPSLRTPLSASLQQAAAPTSGLIHWPSSLRTIRQYPERPFVSWTMDSKAPDQSSASPLQHDMEMAALTAPTSEGYVFPEQRLKQVMEDSSKTPLLLVACGSFSPITYLHLRMFEMAADYVRFSTDFEIVGGYLSPVSDAYKKAGLASAQHRSACLNSCHQSSQTHKSYIASRCVELPWIRPQTG